MISRRWNLEWTFKNGRGEETRLKNQEKGFELSSYGEWFLGQETNFEVSRAHFLLSATNK